MSSELNIHVVLHSVCITVLAVVTVTLAALFVFPCWGAGEEDMLIAVKDNSANPGADDALLLHMKICDATGNENWVASYLFHVGEKAQD